MNTDGIPKRAPTAQAYRGVCGHASPVHFSDFNSLKFPFLGFRVIQIGYIFKSSNLDFFCHLKYIYLFMKNLTDFREKLETGVDPRLISTVAS